MSPLRVALSLGPTVVVVRGGSMRPSLHPGDRVLVQPCTAGDLRRGEIAVLDVNPPLIHRLVARVREGVLLAGDGNPSCDPVRSIETVVGRVVGLWIDDRCCAVRGSRWPAFLRGCRRLYGSLRRRVVAGRERRGRPVADR